MDRLPVVGIAWSAYLLTQLNKAKTKTLPNAILAFLAIGATTNRQ
jgi:hypothetical protein